MIYIFTNNSNQIVAHQRISQNMLQGNLPFKKQKYELD